MNIVCEIRIMQKSMKDEERHPDNTNCDMTNYMAKGQTGP